MYEPEFYEAIVYLFRSIIGKTDLKDHHSRKKKGYNMDILHQKLHARLLINYDR